MSEQAYDGSDGRMSHRSRVARKYDRYKETQLRLPTAGSPSTRHRATSSCRCGPRLSSPRRLKAAAILLPGLIAGCTAYQPKIVVDENGPQYPNAPGSFALFNKHYHDLYLVQFQDNPNNTDLIHEKSENLVREGTALSYQLCQSFFKRAGTEQQWLLFGRDVIGVVGTLATGILGASRASQAATGWVGIGSGAALSGISIYSRNFLFSEDNVAAVQNLTLKAMSDATDKALAAGRTHPDLFSAVNDIMQVQAVCEVQNILLLVRQSINQVQPQAVAVGNRIETQVPPQQAQPIVQPGLNSSSAAEWLRSQDPGKVKNAAALVDNYKVYSDAAQFPLAGSTFARLWIDRNDSDPKHLADVARKMGWRGQ